MPILIFDGVCVLCSGVVQFIIKRDAARLFRFASLQSAAGAALLRQHGLTQADALTSFVVLTAPHAPADNAVLRRSDAALFIARHLAAPWPWLAALGACVPRALRDLCYAAVAANRYRLFGRHADGEAGGGGGGSGEEEQCLAPTKAVTARFVTLEEAAALSKAE